MQSVRIKQSYWLDEQTEAKLQELGAVLVDEVIVTDHYYDNDTFDLATNQIWLSQRGTQWQLIIGAPEADRATDANGDGEEQSEQAKKRVSKSETRGKDSQHTGKLISPGWHQCHPGLKLQNTERSKEQDNEKDKGDATQERQTSATQQLGTRDNNSGTSQHEKVEPRYVHNELKSHRKIIGHIAHFLGLPLTEKEENNMEMNHFCQMAKLHHYASCHTTRRKTYRFQDAYRIIINQDEFTPRNVAIIDVNANVSNIIKELEKMEELAAHLRINPCQTS